MDANRHAYRCLPLSIANAYGWELLSPSTFSIYWNGGPDKSDIRFTCEDNYPSFGRFAESHFSRGIVTFRTGYIFRTEPGWGLLVTGPLNHPKDGIAPLAGVVETDWLPYPFTMNWQLTRPGTVRFEKGEPFCLVYPVMQQALEQTQPEILDLETDPELTASYRAWREERDVFRVHARAGDEEALKAGWQKYYFKGELPDGRQADLGNHIQKLRLDAPIDRRETAATPAANSTEGHVATSAGRVWYRVVGAGDDIPLLVVPGGPGFPHDYLDSLSMLADERRVVFFDPLGCGRSDRPHDPRLWSLEACVARLDEVRRLLQLDRVHLLGHDTGAVLAVEHVLAGASGIASLTLASPCLNVPQLNADSRRMQTELPDEFQTIIAEADSGQVRHPELYQAAVRAYFRRHLCRREPWPISVERTFSGVGQGEYGTLWGPVPTTCKGQLRDYDATSRLASISVPTLLTCGAHDDTTPEAVGALQSQIDGAQLSVFADSSHMPHVEEPEAYLITLRAFLARETVAPTDRRPS